MRYFFRRTGLDVLSGRHFVRTVLRVVISWAYLGHIFGISQACFPMCLNVFKTCSNVIQCAQMCLKMLKTCSNVLVLAVTSGYGRVLGGNGFFGGNGCFLVVTSDK